MRILALAVAALGLGDGFCAVRRPVLKAALRCRRGELAAEGEHAVVGRAEARVAADAESVFLTSLRTECAFLVFDERVKLPATTVADTVLGVAAEAARDVGVELFFLSLARGRLLQGAVV